MARSSSSQVPASRNASFSAYQHPIPTFSPRFACLFSVTSDEALQQTSHFATEPAAKALEESHPELAARLWRAQGTRIVEAGKSKYYDAALGNFMRAKQCYERAGLGVEWERTVRLVSDRHFRKTGFVSGFRAVVSGAYPSEPPVFPRSREGQLA